MKAGIYLGKEDVEIRELPMPEVGERVYPYPRYAKDDTKRAGTIGGFSEYILIPNAKRNHSLYAVDARISDKLASLIEPFTVGCRAARRGMIPDANGSKRYIAGQNAVVFGCGTIGIAAAVAFRHFGMDKAIRTASDVEHSGNVVIKFES